MATSCTQTEEQSWDITHPDQPTSFRIEQCRIDADACLPLCTLVMMTNQVESTSGPTACDVEFEGATTHVKATYTSFNGGVACPVDDSAS
ncbi:MAG TPA: hypothetical protein VGC41_20190 [Kofleriaceae bacterium]